MVISVGGTLPFHSCLKAAELHAIALPEHDEAASSRYYTTSILDFIPSANHAAIQAGNCQIDLAPYIDNAVRSLLLRLGGGTLYFPEGSYPVSEINLSDQQPNFSQSIRLLGAGRLSTKITPFMTGAVLLNLAGRNNCTVQSLSFEASAYAAQCGIFQCRSKASPNANNNKFIDLLVAGNFSKACVVSIAAESSLWLNCRRSNSNAGSGHKCFYTSSHNDTIKVSPLHGGPAIAGPNTDNRQIACEDYAPYPNAAPVTFGGGSGYVNFGCSIIGGDASGVRLVTYADLDGGVFHGPVTWIEPHFEVFGTANTVHWLAGTPKAVSYFAGINSLGGNYVVDDGCAALDYDRTNVTNQPILQGSRWTAPMISPGLSFGPTFNIYGLDDCDLRWRLFQGHGTVLILGYMARSKVEANNLIVAQIISGEAPVYVAALPKSGTFAIGQHLANNAEAIGQPQGWLCTVPGTLGTLRGVNGTTTAGTNFITVNSVVGLNAGQLIEIAGAWSGGPFRINKIVGKTVYLGTNLVTAVASAPITFVAATLTPLRRY